MNKLLFLILLISGLTFSQKNKVEETVNNPIISKNNLYEYLNGLSLFEEKKYDDALNIFLKITSRNNVDDNLLAETYFQIGKIESIKNNYKLSIDNLKKALEKNSSLKNQDQRLRISQTLNSVYERYSEKEKESFLKRIEKENISQQKSQTFAKIISILAIALISILSLLSLSLYKNNVLRNQSNTLLKEKNSELIIAKENAEKASKARSEFLSTVSHELRTPLNAINGIAHLLIEENPKDSQINYLQSLKFSGNYLLNFINDILEINRVESENIPIEKINCSIKTLLNDLKKSFQEITQENNNTFILEISDSIPDNVLGDPTKLSQIFMNLINNSLKFTKNGFVKVVADTEKKDGKNIVIVFKISDNGIGIPEDKQETIFDSFSQGSIEINRKYGGTGLGLSIVKRLIELLGGKITLVSKVGLGTSFSFSLPFEINENLIIDKKEIKYNSNDIINKNILLVEDNKINQMITKKMLENRGMSCHIVDNGEDCVSILKDKNNFDLVLMDVHLPGINGTVATQQIREFNNSTPIIALTAISLNENREMLMSYGMTDVITKPFEPEKFYSIIAKNLS